MRHFNHLLNSRLKIRVDSDKYIFILNIIKQNKQNGVYLYYDFVFNTESKNLYFKATECIFKNHLTNQIVNKILFENRYSYDKDIYDGEDTTQQQEVDVWYDSWNEKFELEKQIPKLEISNQKPNNSKNRI